MDAWKTPQLHWHGEKIRQMQIATVNKAFGNS